MTRWMTPEAKERFLKARAKARKRSKAKPPKKRKHGRPR